MQLKQARAGNITSTGGIAFKELPLTRRVPISESGLLPVWLSDYEITFYIGIFFAKWAFIRPSEIGYKRFVGVLKTWV